MFIVLCYLPLSNCQNIYFHIVLMLGLSICKVQCQHAVFIILISKVSGQTELTTTSHGILGIFFNLNFSNSFFQAEKYKQNMMNMNMFVFADFVLIYCDVCYLFYSLSNNYSLSRYRVTDADVRICFREKQTRQIMLRGVQGCS